MQNRVCGRRAHYSRHTGLWDAEVLTQTLGLPGSPLLGQPPLFCQAALGSSCADKDSREGNGKPGASLGSTQAAAEGHEHPRQMGAWGAPGSQAWPGQQGCASEHQARAPSPVSWDARRSRTLLWEGTQMLYGRGKP